jgi:LCP family protein required for cell wall assembly
VTDQRDGDGVDGFGAAGDPPATDPPTDDASDDGARRFIDDEQSEQEREPEPKRGFVRRHKVLTILCSLFLVLVLALVGGAFYLNHVLFGDIDRIDAFGSIDEKTRPDPAEGEALNILLAGADNGYYTESASIAEALESGEWPPGLYRSDTIMVLHIPADRDRAYVVSIPRDSYVRIYDETGDPTEKHKINYAFSVYGPSGYVSTIEHLTNLRMDHLAIIDWAGFKDVVDALGGVRLYVPQRVYDSSQKFTYTQGWHDYDGETALKYVRSRYALPEGDFDRNRRQQNFLRAMLDKLADIGAMSDFPKFLSTAKAITSNLTIDKEWSNDDMRDLGWAMRGIRKDDVTFLESPINKQHPFGTTPEDGSVVYLDTRGLSDLFTSMRNDDMDAYVREHPNLTLPSETQIN